MSNNYPRDEFDRVPEFNDHVGSHRANGWAQAAAGKGPRGGLRWIVVAAVLALVVGVVAFFAGPGLKDTQAAGAGEETASSSAATQSSQESSTPAEETSGSAAAGDEESEAPEEESSSPAIDDSAVLYNQLVGVYNAAGIQNLAAQGRQVLVDAGFTQVAANQWTRPARESTVYYMAPADLETARKVADLMGIDDVLQTTNIPNRVTAVLGEDDVLGALG